MTKEELWNLRLEIVLGSLFLKDYSNSFGIPVATCCDFFDGFIDDCFDRESDETSFEQVCDKYDNPDSLWEYYCYMYVEDPFIVCEVKDET